MSLYYRWSTQAPENCPTESFNSMKGIHIMNLSLIGLIASCAVASTAFARPTQLNDVPGSHPPQAQVMDVPGSHPPQAQVMDVPGSHPPQAQVMDVPGSHPPQLSTLR
jgi:hypothetical protein